MATIVLRLYEGEHEQIRSAIHLLGGHKDGTVYRLNHATITVYARKVLLQNADLELARSLVKALVPIRPHCGSDEAGKGDIFGPLVVAGVCLDDQLAMRLAMDSKDVSDATVKRLASFFRQHSKLAITLVQPWELNANMNSILLRSHIIVKKALGDCQPFYVDDFGASQELKSNGFLPLVRGEIIPAVAAASIVARGVFLEWLEEHGLPPGSSRTAQDKARSISEQQGCDTLKRLAKANFKTVQELCSGK